MAMGMQRTGIRSMTVGTQCSGDNLGTEAIHLYQWKTTKTQRTGIRSMAASAQRTDSDPRAEANHYMIGARRKGKSLKNVSAQQTNSGLMAMLQRMIKPRLMLSIK